MLLIGLVGVPGWLTYRQMRQDRLDRDLIAAIKCNDTPVALSLLSQGADANVRDEPQRKSATLWQLLRNTLRYKHSPPSAAPTALFVILQSDQSGSAKWEYMEENALLVKALLDHGARVNIQNSQGMTPLQLAEERGYATTMRLLLAHGADINRADAHGTTPLMTAAAMRLEFLLYLLDQGTRMNQQDQEGWTALMYAVDANQIQAVRLLLHRRACVNIKGKDGATALSLAKNAYRSAIAFSKEEAALLVQLLKQAGAKE